MPISTTRLRIADVLARRGYGKSRHYRDIQDQLMTPPIKRGPKFAFWPEHEVEAITRAEIAGATEEQIRALVRLLVEQRKQLAGDTGIGGAP